MQEQQQPPSTEPEIYLTECASCGGQFPTFRAICSECEDAADAEGFRDGKKVVSSESTPAKSSAERSPVAAPAV